MAAASSSFSSPSEFESWLDLQDHLWEKILERLAIADYLRFGAVCRRWHSVQSDHRRRRRQIKRPWFIPQPSEPSEEGSVICFDAFASGGEQRLHPIVMPRYGEYLELRHEMGGAGDFSFSLPNDWLLLDDWPSSHGTYYFSLVNPFMDVYYELPDVGDTLIVQLRTATASTTCPPDSVLLVTTDKWSTKLQLIRDSGSGDYCYWMELDSGCFGLEYDELDYIPLEQISPIFWEGEYYCMFLGRGLVVVDPWFDKELRFEKKPGYLLEMDQSVLPKYDRRKHNESMEAFLVESNGQLLLVVQFWQVQGVGRTSVLGFQVFEADFDRKRWVEVESLGDRVLLLYRGLILSLLAADIGATKNCIYYVAQQVGDQVSWNEFDMDIGEIKEASLAYAPTPCTHLMFMPSIY